MEREPDHVGLETDAIGRAAVNQNVRTSGVSLGDMDGVLFGLSGIRIAQIEDGTSKTMLIGEARHDIDAQRQVGMTRESDSGDHKDHWYIGSDDIDVHNDASEVLGSTAVPLNLHRSLDTITACRNVANANCQALQLSFSSEHSGVVQVVLPVP